MLIKKRYNHLNAREYLLVNKSAQLEEIERAIKSVDANQFTKVSKDKKRLGQTLYKQSEINKALKNILTNSGWKSLKTYYYVADDVNIEKQIVRIKDKKKQKEFIINSGHEAYSTNNQVDFVKDRIAVEVQFGKYFSVAYDLHVKHTFFFLMDDIDVGIEIIPTKAMMQKMDTGVSWFENEVANVIREGRSNPSVPILILGIEPEEILP